MLVVATELPLVHTLRPSLLLVSMSVEACWCLCRWRQTDGDDWRRQADAADQSDSGRDAVAFAVSGICLQLLVSVSVDVD